MIISTEEIVVEMKEVGVAKELRSAILVKEVLDKQEDLFYETEIFNNALNEKQKVAFEKLDEQYYDYCRVCENEAFYYGFKLGLKLAQEK